MAVAGSFPGTMKDDTTTPMADGDSPNQFERDTPVTAERSQAEASIENLRQRGGVFVSAVRATRMPMVLTDPNLPGNPVVFANEAFLKLSGYSMDEVLGQQPHFMNGPNTDPKDAARFTEALRADQDDIIETVQYCKNGTHFIATVLLSAFKDEQGRTLNHFMSWLDVTRRVEAEHEIGELRKLQAALRASEERLAAELESAKILQEVSSLLIKDSDGEELFDRILEAAMEIMHAQFASLQLLNGAEEQLQLISWRNFHPDSAAYWESVDVTTGTSCGSALAHGERVVIPDVDKCETLRGTESLRQYHRSGIKAVQSTPLTSRSGRVIGMMSTHWREICEPDEQRLRLFDTLARQAADFVVRARVEAALRESERHTQTLLAELQHRVRNTLGVVRSIVRRTADNSKTVKDMLAHFQGRLDAFSRVQAALVRNKSGKVDLRSIVDDEMLAHVGLTGKQVDVSGPEILLEPKAAERLSLAIHELTTNAVKHGALTNGGGHIRIDWTTERDGNDEELILNWAETGICGDTSKSPREGFGMELLLRSLPYDVRGKTNLELTDEALEFELRMPLGSR